jgi:hypothetical protein
LEKEPFKTRSVLVYQKIKERKKEREREREREREQR